MANSLPALLLSVIWLGAIFLTSVVYGAVGVVIHWPPLQVVFAAISFVLLFPLLSGLVSKFGVSGIKKGIFPREALHPVYLRRRIYGLCWTQVFYFSPLYAIVMAVPLFRKIVFRLFGYRGALNFITYPDTWIRDLPLLTLGEGAYLSNKATIGTNICLSNGSILVDKIDVGPKALVGHLTMLAPGVKVGEQSEIGVGSAIGIRTRIGKNVKIDPTCAISHGVIIGDHAEIGAHSYIGLRVEIAAGLKVPAGANIPAGTILGKQEDLNSYMSSETNYLRRVKNDVLEILKNA
jgi:carbonic anhydrase/acetyltransferase-like protein (isoleucine patch superfamily)